MTSLLLWMLILELFQSDLVMMNKYLSYAINFWDYFSIKGYLYGFIYKIHLHLLC